MLILRRFGYSPRLPRHPAAAELFARRGSNPRGCPPAPVEPLTAEGVLAKTYRLLVAAASRRCASPPVVPAALRSPQLHRPPRSRIPREPLRLDTCTSRRPGRRHRAARPTGIPSTPRDFPRRNPTGFCVSIFVMPARSRSAPTATSTSPKTAPKTTARISTNARGRRLRTGRLGTHCENRSAGCTFRKKPLYVAVDQRGYHRRSRHAGDRPAATPPKRFTLLARAGTTSRRLNQISGRRR